MLSPERQSARMSKIKSEGLDQYGAEAFEQLALKELMPHSIHHSQPIAWLVQKLKSSQPGNQVTM